MKILITGNKGFVGRHFTEFYERIGHSVLGVDIAESMDVRTFFNISNQTKYDLVIHLAAVVGGRAKIEGQPLSVAVDLSIDAEMWQWAIRTKQPAVVYFSSSAAYPEGVRTYVFRPFSGYGEDQALDYPFPSFIKRGADRDNPFVIWGDGTQTRDFVHISDIVKCVDTAVSNDYDKPLNIGTGHPTSFMELGEMVAKHAGYFPKFQLLKDKPEGVNWRVADITNMSEIYRPKIDLDEGIARALKHFKKQ